MSDKQCFFKKKNSEIILGMWTIVY